MFRTNSGSHSIGSRTIHVVDSSITDAAGRVDALVSSDDNRLSHGGGVSAAIWAAAGRSLRAVIERAQPVLRLGDVFVSPAGDLPARMLLHAVTIDLDANRAASDADIALLYRRVLDTAEDRDCTSIALPLLGTGAAGLSPDASVRGLTEALDAWLAGPSHLKTVILACPGPHGGQVAEAMESLAREAVPMDELVGYATAGPGDSADALARCWKELSAPGVSARGPLLGVLFDSATRLAAQRILESVGGALGSLLDARGTDADAAANLSSFIPGAVGSRTIDEVVEFLPQAAALVGFRPRTPLEPVLRRGLLARNRLAYQAYSPALVVERDHICIAAREALRLMVSSAGTDPFSPHGSPRRSIPSESRRPAPPASARRPAAPPPPSSHRVLGARHPGLRDESAIPPSASASRSMRRDDFDDAPASAGPDYLASPGQPEPVVHVSTTTQASGTEQVRRLHALCLTHLTGAVRKFLDESLLKEGYQGDFSSRLLEKCVRVDDPAAFILEYFGMPGLMAASEELFGKSPAPGTTPARLASRIVAHIGFPSRPAPVGLPVLLAKIKRRKQRLPLMSAEEVRGAVAEVGGDLEFVCLVLVRFMCQAAFGKPPELLLRDWGHLTTSQTLANVGLGTLLRLAEKVDARLGDDQSAMAHLFADTVGLQSAGSGTAGGSDRRRLFPETASVLPQVRNAFSHFREHSEASRGHEALRHDASTFLDAAEGLLDYLQSCDARVFPQVVRIEGIAIDKWGRRTIRAVDDEEHEHTLFTDVAVEPGQAYFMYARTNPLRVDPILVPAGDMTWPSVR